MNQRKLYRNGQSASRGFSTLELLLVMAVSLVIAAFSIPGFNQVRRTLRISGDARDLNGAINQAKLMAAADFTETRVWIDLGTAAVPGTTYHVDVWNRNGIAPNVGCWQTVGDFVPGVLPPQPRCIIPGTSPVQNLSPGVSFGFAGLAAPPLNTQANIVQGPEPNSCAPVNGKRVGQPATSACIQFNSRGFPIDINAGGVPTGNGAFYIMDTPTPFSKSSQVYAVTLNATGLSQVWANNIKGNGTVGNGNNGNGWYRK